MKVTADGFEYDGQTFKSISGLRPAHRRVHDQRPGLLQAGRAEGRGGEVMGEPSIAAQVVALTHLNVARAARTLAGGLRRGDHPAAQAVPDRSGSRGNSSGGTSARSCRPRPRRGSTNCRRSSATRRRRSGSGGHGTTGPPPLPPLTGPRPVRAAKAPKPGTVLARDYKGTARHGHRRGRRVPVRRAGLPVAVGRRQGDHRQPLLRRRVLRAVQ